MAPFQVTKTYRSMKSGAKAHRKVFPRTIVKWVKQNEEDSLFPLLSAENIRHYKSIKQKYRCSPKPVYAWNNDSSGSTKSLHIGYNDSTPNKTFDSLLSGPSFQDVKYQTPEGSITETPATWTQVPEDNFWDLSTVRNTSCSTENANCRTKRSGGSAHSVTNGASNLGHGRKKGSSQQVDSEQELSGELSLLHRFEELESVFCESDYLNFLKLSSVLEHERVDNYQEKDVVPSEQSSRRHMRISSYPRPSHSSDQSPGRIVAFPESNFDRFLDYVEYLETTGAVAGGAGEDVPGSDNFDNYETYKKFVELSAAIAKKSVGDPVTVPNYVFCTGSPEQSYLPRTDGDGKMPNVGERREDESLEESSIEGIDGTSLAEDLTDRLSLKKSTLNLDMPMRSAEPEVSSTSNYKRPCLSLTVGDEKTLMKKFEKAMNKRVMSTPWMRHSLKERFSSKDLAEKTLGVELTTHLVAPGDTANESTPGPEVVEMTSVVNLSLGDSATERSEKESLEPPELSLCKDNRTNAGSCNLLTKKLSSLKITPRPARSITSSANAHHDSCLSHSVMNHTSSHASSMCVLVLDEETPSTSFGEVFHNASLAEQTSLFRLGVSAREIPLPVLPSITAESVVLERCGQKRPVSFSVALPKSVLKTCKKIGEGSYGEVFIIKRDHSSSVIKIMPIMGNFPVNGEPQKTYEEIVSEIVIAMELSNLRTNPNNRTSNYCKLIKPWLIKGKYPTELLSQWKDYDNRKGSYNENPQIFRSNQLFIMLELEHSGCDMESYHLNSAEEGLSIFLQVACSLAVGEKALEFEHRDLHLGNILLSKTDLSTANFFLDGEVLEVPTRNIYAVIIDFTLSRVKFDGCIIYNDLAADPEIFNGGTHDFQFEVYRLMRDMTENEWQKFVPVTNVLWLKYLLDKLICGVAYKYPTSKKHKRAIGELQQFYECILDNCSAEEFVERNRGHFMR